MSVRKVITKATGPLVNIASAKKNQGIIQRLFVLIDILLQKPKRLIPIVPHKRESLTAVLLQIIINGEDAKHKAETNERYILLFESSVKQNKVSAIISIKNNADKAEGNLADKDPKLSQI